jgi:hypothetical protein
METRSGKRKPIYLGMNAELNKKVKSNDWDASFQLGVGFLMLLLILNYPYVEQKHNFRKHKLGDIDETNVYIQNSNSKLTINPAVDWIISSLITEIS